MSQSDEVLAAGDALAGALYDARQDEAYGPWDARLEEAHRKLQGCLEAIIRSPGRVDGAPADRVNAVIDSCNAATEALGSATTGNKREQAVTQSESATSALCAL
jgi:hypothetical protein